jgi:hypothetical protein
MITSALDCFFLRRVRGTGSSSRIVTVVRMRFAIFLPLLASLSFFVSPDISLLVADFLSVAIGQPRRDNKDGEEQNKQHQEVHWTIPHGRQDIANVLASRGDSGRGC